MGRSSEREYMTTEINNVTFLSAPDAAQVDINLTTTEGFTLDQLMELAGLSVATSLCEEFSKPNQRILTVCGPGNNGGDGLVASRHLTNFGHSVDVWYPKPTPKPLYDKLVVQARCAGAQFVDAVTPTQLSLYDLVIDAIFGFSFKGEIRAPFTDVLTLLRDARCPPIVSVDVPSGWDVELGNISGLGLNPVMLISLTCPKLCARHFRGVHYLGGRFISPGFRATHCLALPSYPGTLQHVKLHSAL